MIHIPLIFAAFAARKVAEAFSGNGNNTSIQVIDQGRIETSSWVVVPRHQVGAVRSAHPNYHLAENFFKVVENMRRRDPACHEALLGITAGLIKVVEAYPGRAVMISLD